MRSYLDSSNWSGRGPRPRWLELLAISGAILTAPSMTRLGTMSCRLASMEEGLTELAGRLTLLMEHLAGDALARRVDRADLVQETLLRLLRSGATERAADEGDSALWAHARTMARRVVVDAARKALFEPRRLSSLVPRRRTQPGTADSTSGPVHAAGRPGPATEATVRVLAASSSIPGTASPAETKKCSTSSQISPLRLSTCITFACPRCRWIREVLNGREL